MYSSPKNLVHRSKVQDLTIVKTSTTRPPKRKSALPKPKKTVDYEIDTEQDEMEEGTFDTEDLTDDDGRGSSVKQEVVEYAVKRRKLEDTDEHTQYEVQTNGDDKVEFIIVSGQPEKNARMTADEQPAASKEERFIQAVYPQFQGKTRLQLIDEILDSQRRIDLLQDKVKTFEDTINRLLN